MLVLTRRTGEGIVIGDDIIITVVESKGGAIRIGIEAPKSKKIYRQELYDKISQENRNAVNWSPEDLDLINARLPLKDSEK